MEVFDLTLNKDYFIPLTKNEMIEKLEYYKAFSIAYDRQISLKSKEYFELLDSLVNLEIKAFELRFPSNVIIPNILRDVLKYNVWQLTKRRVEAFKNKDIILTKEEEKHGFVTAHETVIADISLKPPYAFTTPSIYVYSYEQDYELARERMLQLKDEYEQGKNMCDSYTMNMIEANIEEYMGLTNNLEEMRKLLNEYRKNLCLYRNPLYKELAQALLEEYNIKDEHLKDYTKNLSWIKIIKKSL